MKAKQKNQDRDIILGGLNLRINRHGDVLFKYGHGEDSYCVILTGKDLDDIAEHCAALSAFKTKLESFLKNICLPHYSGPVQDRNGCEFDVVFEDYVGIISMLKGTNIDDGVCIGCQHFEARTVARIARLSLAMRKNKKK